MLSRPRRIFLLLFPTVLLLALLVLTELVLRLAVPSLSVPFVTAVLEEGTEYLQINRGYLERYFPAGSALVPELKPSLLKKAKDAGSLRLICLGESSMYGVPYEGSATIPALVRRQLRHCEPGREIEVVNLAASAINTNVMVDMAPEVLALQPDLILIYTGHNEFYGPDGAGASWIEKRLPALTAWKYRLRDLRLVRALQRGLASLARPAPGTEKNMMRQVSEGAEVPLDSPDAARVFANFERNLGALLDRCRERGVPVLVSDVSSNLRFPPFASPPVPDSARLRGLMASGRLQEASEALVALGRTDPGNAAVAYWSGEIAEREGKPAEAVHHFERARDLDLLKFRAPGQIDTIIHRVASARGIPCLAADSLLRAHSRDGITDTALFCEHLHPNVRGYDLLSRLFLQAIVQQHPVPGFAEGPCRLLPFNADSLALDWLDLAYGALSLRALTGRWPFTGFVPGPSVLDTADRVELGIVTDFYNRKTGWTKASLQYAEHAEGKQDEAGACRAFAAVLEEYPRAYLVRYLYANALKRTGDLGAAAAQYRQCIAVNGSYPWPRVDLGLILINSGRFAEAREQLEAALRLGGAQGAPATLQATALYGLSAIAANEGRMEEAVRLVEQSLHLVPSYGPARALLAQISRGK